MYELNDEYNDIVNLLIREMIDKEKQLNTRDINKIADMYGLNASELKQKLPIAEKQLYLILKRKK